MLVETYPRCLEALVLTEGLLQYRIKGVRTCEVFQCFMNIEAFVKTCFLLDIMSY